MMITVIKHIVILLFIAATGSAQADISLVGQASDNTDNEASVTVDVSGIGIQDDDLILFFGSCDGTGYDLPAGFTSLQDVNTAGSHNNILAYKVASSEPNSYTVDVTSGIERGIAIFAVYRGVKVTDPIDQSNSNTGGSNQTAVISSITPSNDNSVVAAFVGTESGTATNPFVISWPGSLIEQLDNVNGPPGNGNASSSGAFAHEIQTTSAAVSGNILMSTGNTNWGTMAVVLNNTNSAPTHDAPILTSALGTDTTNEDLTSTPQNTFDADGDDVKNIFNWYKDTNPIQVLNMPFEGGSDGSSTKDYSDSANNGTVNGATWDSTGGFDGKGAYDFSTSYIDVGDPASLNNFDEITISVWVKPDTAINWIDILSKETGDYNTAGYGIRQSGINTVAFAIRTGSKQEIISGTAYDLGSWNHIVGTYDGSTMTLYKNGVSIGTRSTSGSITNSANNLNIGRRVSGSDRYFDGSIDDIQIFKHSLSPEQIQAIYQNRTINTEDVIVSEETTLGETWQSCVTPNDGTVDGVTKCSNDLTIVNATPIAEWRMEEFSWDGTAGEVVDETGNGNDGTANNGADTDDASPAIVGDPGTCGYGTYAQSNSQFVNVPYNASLNPDGDFTVSFWAKVSGSAGTYRSPITSRWENGGATIRQGYIVYAGTNNLWQFWTGVGAAGWDLTTGPAVTIGAWTHVAITYDSTSVNSGIHTGIKSLYINGAATTDINRDYQPNGTNPTTIGAGGGTGASFHFDGDIDEVRVYDRALTGPEILTIVNETHPCPDSNIPEMEVAEITLNDTSVTPAFTSVTFKQTYTTAPQVFILPSNEGQGCPTSIRTRNVTTTGFEVSQVGPEANYGLCVGKGSREAMTVHYLAIESGVHELPDGRAIEVGTHSTTSIQYGGDLTGTETWDTVNFTTTFASQAAVLTGIQGMVNESNNPPTTTSIPWMTTAMRNETTNSVQLALGRSEVNDGGTILNSESIGYVAIEGDAQGSFTSGSATILYESITSADDIQGYDQENCPGNVGQAVPFVNAYTQSPLVMGNISRHDGGDGGWIRRCSLTTTQIGVAVDEDQFRELERDHTTEAASFLVFSEEFCLPTACEAPVVDHYAISYAAYPGVTCEATTVTITAHDSSDIPVDVPGGTILTIDSFHMGTATNVGSLDNVTAGSGVLAGNPGNPVTYTWPSGTEESAVTLHLTHLTPMKIDIDLLDNSSTPASEKGDGDNSDTDEDPVAEFRDAVFRFFAEGTVDTIDTQIAGKESDTAPGDQVLNIRSVQTNPATMACESRITGAQTIQMAFKCIDPTTCHASAPRVEINNTDSITPGNNNADTVDEASGAYTDVDLTFDALGHASFTFDYLDVGEIQLFARLTIPENTPDPEYTLFGASNTFVVKPAGLCVESTDTGSACVSADGTCTTFRKAGSVNSENYFNLSVSGVAWESVGEADSDFCTGNMTTPNFQLGSIALGHAKIAPTGGNSGTLSVTSIDISTGGTETESSQAISEVGVFTVTATPPSYLGEAISASTSANIGRFYPDRFNVTMENTPAFADSCSWLFTYQDQPFYYATAPELEITARNSNGDTTANYGGSFWKLPGSTLPRTYADGSTTSPAASFSGVTGGSVTLAGHTDFDGVGTLTLTSGSGGDEFEYQRNAPEAPFNADVDATFLAAGFQDTDGVCYDSNNVGACDGFSHPTIEGTELRFGRLGMVNVHGSEIVLLEMPMRTELFDGSNFIPNTDDGCTSVAATDLKLSSSVETNQVGGSIVVLQLQPGNIDQISIANIGNDPVVNGDVALSFCPPGNPACTATSGNVGYIDVEADLSPSGSNHPWLQYDWDSGTAFDDNPSARATFGIYKGDDVKIYIQQVYQ